VRTRHCGRVRARRRVNVSRDDFDVSRDDAYTREGDVKVRRDADSDGTVKYAPPARCSGSGRTETRARGAWVLGGAMGHGHGGKEHTPHLNRTCNDTYTVALCLERTRIVVARVHP
jgi:hypothetical protein